MTQKLSLKLCLWMIFTAILISGFLKADFRPVSQFTITRNANADYAVCTSKNVREVAYYTSVGPMLEKRIDYLEFENSFQKDTIKALERDRDSRYIARIPFSRIGITRDFAFGLLVGALWIAL